MRALQCTDIRMHENARPSVLAPRRGLFCAADVHEQKKPWVPLMLEASYRPSGWLGIMCAACR